MPKHKHTPGPWLQSGPYGHFPPAQVGYFDVREKSDTVDGAVHAQVHIPTGTREGLGRAEANARLIAAAPELLDALELARQHIIHRSDCRFVTAQCRDSSTSCTCGARSAADKALAVITKVKGMGQ